MRQPRARHTVRLGLLGCLLLTGCQATNNYLFGVGDCKLEQLGQTPVQTRQNLVLVTAQVNGQPVRLVVDTGSERTLLNVSTATRLSLNRDFDNATRSWGVGGQTARFDASLNSFVLAGLRLPLRHVAVGDLAVTPLGDVDGVLGTDVLRWFAVDLDAPGGQMTLYRAEPCWIAAPPWPGPAIQLAGVVVNRHSLDFPRRILLPIELDGVAATALLDTGSQSSAITLTLAGRVGVTDAVLKTDPSMSIGGTGPDAAIVPLHRFRSIRVGNWVANDPILPVLDLPHDIEQRPEVTDRLFQALVGQDFLHGHRIWFSMAGWQVFVSPTVTAAR
ncbi:MAG TPA: retropepsin-like aspartic protease [Acetobacteraceae bacterium]